MNDLWTQIQEVRQTEAETHVFDNRLVDLRWRRGEEIRSEIPVPFCCPKAAGIRTIRPFLLSNDVDCPIWIASGSPEGIIRRSIAIHCPFCGTKLPEFCLKKEPPRHLQIEEDRKCGRCKERYINCYCSDPLSIWEVSNSPPILAATALLMEKPDRHQPLVLSVSRKNDPKAKGLPGGKLEPGETAEQAMCRELLEETGYEALEYHKVFDAMDELGIRVVTFRVTKFNKQLDSAEKGIVEWIQPKDFVTASPFATFNWSLLQMTVMHLDLPLM